MTAPPKRRPGRPMGYVVSAETRAKTSATKTARWSWRDVPGLSPATRVIAQRITRLKMASAAVIRDCGR